MRIKNGHFHENSWWRRIRGKMSVTEVPWGHCWSAVAYNGRLQWFSDSWNEINLASSTIEEWVLMLTQNDLVWLGEWFKTVQLLILGFRPGEVLFLVGMNSDRWRYDPKWKCKPLFWKHREWHSHVDLLLLVSTCLYHWQAEIYSFCYCVFPNMQYWAWWFVHPPKLDSIRVRPSRPIRWRQLQVQGWTIHDFHPNLASLNVPYQAGMLQERSIIIIIIINFVVGIVKAKSFIWGKPGSGFKGATMVSGYNCDCFKILSKRYVFTLTWKSALACNRWLGRDTAPKRPIIFDEGEWWMHPSTSFTWTGRHWWKQPARRWRLVVMMNLALTRCWHVS